MSRHHISTTSYTSDHLFRGITSGEGRQSLVSKPYPEIVVGVQKGMNTLISFGQLHVDVLQVSASDPWSKIQLTSRIPLGSKVRRLIPEDRRKRFGATVERGEKRDPWPLPLATHFRGIWVPPSSIYHLVNHTPTLSMHTPSPRPQIYACCRHRHVGWKGSLKTYGAFTERAPRKAMGISEKLISGNGVPIYLHVSALCHSEVKGVGCSHESIVRFDIVVPLFWHV